MKAIILAAGRGSRMKNLTDERPKCLLELRGKTLLEWQLEALRGAGINEIAIVTGYKREMLADQGLVEFHNSRWAETQMVSSLACASDWLRADPCIVSYSDIFYHQDAVKSLMVRDANLALTYDPNWKKLWARRFGDPLLDAETFRLTKESILLEIGNKPRSVEEIQGQYMGLLRFTPEGWEEIERLQSSLGKEDSEKIQLTRALQMVLDAQRISIFGECYNGVWGEIDTCEDLALFEGMRTNS
jgi:choline kinase